LRSESDLRRFAGERVEVKLRDAVEGRKVFNGILVADEAGQEQEKTTFGVEFEAKKNDIQVVRFTFDDVERAKLDPVLDFKGKKR